MNSYYTTEANDLSDGDYSLEEAEVQDRLSGIRDVECVCFNGFIVVQWKQESAREEVEMLLKKEPRFQEHRKRIKLIPYAEVLRRATPQLVPSQE